MIKKFVKKAEKKTEIDEKLEKLDEKVEGTVAEESEELDKAIEKAEKAVTRKIGTANGNPVVQETNFVRFQRTEGVIPMYKLPEDLQKYLINNGFGTNVYKKDKEWLEKHGADMNMINKLKQFISDSYNL